MKSDTCLNWVQVLALALLGPILVRVYCCYYLFYYSVEVLSWVLVAEG